MALPLNLLSQLLKEKIVVKKGKEWTTTKNRKYQPSSNDQQKVYRFLVLSRVRSKLIVSHLHKPTVLHRIMVGVEPEI